MKLQNIYLLLAAVCCVALCVVSPVYFTSGEDANHYFSFQFMHLNAMQYDAEGQLVADEAFTYATHDEAGEVISTTTGSALMNVWALPLLALVMGLLSLVDLVWGFFATKVKHILWQSQLCIFTVICALGYYAMLALYVFFASARFELDWHLAWPACLPVIVLILTLMSMRAFSGQAKKIKRDLSGSIR